MEKNPNKLLSVFLNHYAIVPTPYSHCFSFSFIFYTFFRGDSVSVEVGQDFLCNMLYNCINNKSENIWVVYICIHFKWDRTENTFSIKRRPCLPVNMQRAGSSCLLLSITATRSRGDVERRERLTNCQADRNLAKMTKTALSLMTISEAVVTCFTDAIRLCTPGLPKGQSFDLCFYKKSKIYKSNHCFCSFGQGKMLLIYIRVPNYH